MRKIENQKKWKNGKNEKSEKWKNAKVKKEMENEKTLNSKISHQYIS